MQRIATSISKRHTLSITTTSKEPVLKGTSSLRILSFCNDLLFRNQNFSETCMLQCHSFSSKSWNWKDTIIKSSSSSSSSSRETQQMIEPNVQSQILSQCAEIHSSIMPLNEKLRGPLAKHSDRQTCMPFVFLVGNHSSGKSSFINYALGRNIQTAGVAPTDDCFTVITPNIPCISR